MRTGTQAQRISLADGLRKKSNFKLEFDIAMLIDSWRGRSGAVH